MKEKQALFATQIIGGGPGGLGIPIVVTRKNAFDKVDQQYLEALLKENFATRSLVG